MWSKTAYCFFMIVLSVLFVNSRSYANVYEYTIIDERYDNESADFYNLFSNGNIYTAGLRGPDADNSRNIYCYYNKSYLKAYDKNGDSWFFIIKDDDAYYVHPSRTDLAEYIYPDVLSFNGKNYEVKSIGGSGEKYCDDTVDKSTYAIDDTYFFDPEGGQRSCCMLTQTKYVGWRYIIGSFGAGEINGAIQYTNPTLQQDGYSNTYVYNTTLKKVYIPESVKIIERGTFINCIALSEVSGAKGIEEIQEKAFYVCPLSFILNESQSRNSKEDSLFIKEENVYRYNGYKYITGVDNSYAENYRWRISTRYQNKLIFPKISKNTIIGADVLAGRKDFVFEYVNDGERKCENGHIYNIDQFDEKIEKWCPYCHDEIVELKTKVLDKEVAKKNVYMEIMALYRDESIRMVDYACICLKYNDRVIYEKEQCESFEHGIYEFDRSLFSNSGKYVIEAGVNGVWSSDEFWVVDAQQSEKEKKLTGIQITHYASEEKTKIEAFFSDGSIEDVTGNAVITRVIYENKIKKESFEMITASYKGFFSKELYNKKIIDENKSNILQDDNSIFGLMTEFCEKTGLPYISEKRICKDDGCLINSDALYPKCSGCVSDLKSRMVVVV